MSNSSLYNELSIFERAFPTPEYLSMPAVGIDISDHAIKYISFKRKHGRIELGAYGKIDLPLDVIEQGEIKDAETIIKLLSRVKDDCGISFVHLALPEDHAYLFQMEVPNGSQKKIEQILEFHLKENIPLGADEALFDYEIFKKGKENCELNVSAYPDIIARQYIQMLDEAGFTVLSVEIEGQATARALLKKEDVAPLLIVDIGRNDTSLSISTKRVVTFTANLETGGDYFTHSIARGLDISFQEADKLKRKYGIRNTAESEGVFKVLFPVVSKFAETIQKHIMFWQMHMNSSGIEANEVSKIVLVGGNANIEGIAEYLESILSVPVEVGNVWGNTFSFEEYIPPIHAELSLEYTTAIGLALKSFLFGK